MSKYALSPEEAERKKARDKLWEMGILDWKLTIPQKAIKKGILEDDNKISVVLCSRRLGKTYLLITMAAEVCLKKSYAVVKYAFPKQNMAKKMLMPVVRKVFEDCPDHLKPVYMTAEKVFRFPNGSEIQISGVDNGGWENLRGGDSDLNCLDESGFMDDLTYGVRSVMSPTVKITKGRTIMVSTPSRSENHEFIQDWVLPYQAENRIKIYTIYDNPQFNAEAIKEAEEEYPQGVEDPMFRREYMCHIIRNADKSILPSFNSKAEAEIIRDDFEVPMFCDKYVALDPGGTDLTGVLFGYYDFEKACLVILDEIAVDGTTNTAILADLIKEKEKLYWTNPIDQSVDQPFMRVSDVSNAILLTDLQKLHNLTFSKTKKDKKQAAINSLDVTIMKREIIIHPRCVNLLYHMRFAEWNKAETEFKRLKASPSGKLPASHCDLLDCLIYMHRNVVKSHNPFPNGHGKQTGSNVFNSLFKPENKSGDLAQVFSKLLNKKSKKH
jgi:hypothetical protein